MVSKMNEKGISISFAFIKASQGVSLRDPMFRYNWNESEKYPILRSAYHYFECDKSGKEQALFFLSIVDVKSCELPPVVDVEELKTGCNKKKFLKNLNLFIEVVEKSYGKKMIIYSGKDFYNEHLKNNINSKNPIWIANYYVPKLDAKLAWKFWQYSDKASISGINSTVDMNAYNGSIEAFKKEFAP